jgi:hypothetical protein
VSVSMRNWRLRSPLTARICSCMLATIIVAYLLMITYLLHDRLYSSRNVLLLVFLWCLGILALISLGRGWRHFRKLKDQKHSQK